MVEHKYGGRVFAAVALLLALGGCTATQGDISADDYYELAGGLPAFQGASEERLDEIGHNVCSALRSDSKDVAWARTVKAVTDGGVPASDAGKLIAYATARHCPDMADRLPPT